MFMLMSVHFNDIFMHILQVNISLEKLYAITQYCLIMVIVINVCVG